MSRAASPRARSSSASSRKRVLPPERRAQLLALGLELFSQHTYDEVSIDEVARLAGISKGLLYHYFSDKRGFYVATVEASCATMLELTRFEDNSAPAFERLRLGVDAYLDYVERHGAAFAALLRSGVGADPKVSAIVDRTRDEILDRLFRGAPQPLPPTPLVRIALRGWIGMVEAASLEWLTSPRAHTTPREHLREVMCHSLVAIVGLASGEEGLVNALPTRDSAAQGQGPSRALDEASAHAMSS
ncbi:MAG: TetR/AcrR family transcriptional regulator [Polyangiaceae bacterium]